MFQLTCPGNQCIRNDVLSGLTVALALVPEAVAFAFVAGVEPLVGLYGALMMGLITAIIGGRPGMISGATGAMAVVMVALVATHGVQYLFAAVVLTGIIQVLAGVFRLGKFIRMVPYPVMLGFVNGLAIVIFLAQMKQFQVPGADGELTWMTGTSLWILLGLIALTMAIIQFLPKLTVAVPASLAAIVTVTLIVIGLDLDTRTVQDVLRDMSGDPAATIAGGLPSFSIPSVPFTLETLQIILPYSVILAAVGLIESLLTLRLIDEITETRGRGNKECVGQGVANNEHGVKIYEMSGPLFFGSIQAFQEIFDPKNDPREVMVDFYDSKVVDHSGLEAIDALAERYQRAGKTLHLKHLSRECHVLLQKAGDLVEVNLMEDPRYHVADDRLA